MRHARSPTRRGEAQPAPAEGLQPAHRSLRACRYVASNTYYDWLLDHAFLLVPAQAYVGQWLASFKELKQRQKAVRFNMDEVMQKLQEPHNK